MCALRASFQGFGSRLHEPAALREGHACQGVCRKVPVALITINYWETMQIPGFSQAYAHSFYSALQILQVIFLEPFLLFAVFFKFTLKIKVEESKEQEDGCHGKETLIF